MKIESTTTPEDIVRVIRIIEYEGPRSWVEATLAKSIQGEKRVTENAIIRAATLGLFPEILKEKTDAK